MEARLSNDENFDTFFNRVKKYFDQWTGLAEASDFESLYFSILKERILESCMKSSVPLLEKKNNSYMGELKKLRTPTQILDFTKRS